MTDNSDHTARAAPLIASAESLRSLDELRAVHRATLRLQHVLAPEELAIEVIAVLEDILGYEHAAVLLIDEYSERLLPFALSDAGRGAGFVVRDRDNILKHNVRLDVGITGWVAAHGVSVLSGDVQSDERYIGLRDSIASELCVPMWSEGRVIGVVNIETTRRDAYSRADQRVLEIVASQIAVAIQNHRLQQALAHSQRLDAIGRLTSGIAHDFNNLLTVINGHAELLSLREGLPRAAGESLEQIVEAGRQAAGVTQRLLAFARKSVLHPRVVNLYDVITQAQTMLARILGSAIRLRLPPDTEAAPVQIDPGQFTQVLINLAINARDAMPDGGDFAIDLTTRHVLHQVLTGDGSVTPGHYTIVTITDNGAGMNETLRRSVFEPFCTTKSDGSGLGLAMVHGIIRQSGGDIRVQSAPGEGSTFEILLPVADVVSTPGQIPTSLRKAPRIHGQVLVVDDNDQVRRLLVTLLESLGYQVLSAACADEALAATQDNKERIEVVVCDVVMPGLSGPQLVARLRLMQPAVRVLFVSGYPRDSVSVEGQFLPTDALLSKPFTRATLKQKLIDLLEP